MMRPRQIVLPIILGLLCIALSSAYLWAENSDVCIACHGVNSPALVMEWEFSRHGQSKVGCLDCHETERGDVDVLFEEIGLP